MIVTNQIEHLRFLYSNSLYEDIIDYATVTLQLALEQARYEEALRCYEYLAGAYHDLGRNKEFSEIMVDYEQICLAYGSRESKMNFYVWLSLMHLVAQQHKLAIKAGQKAIMYGHYFEDYRVVCINLGNLCWQYTALKDYEQALLCAKLGRYYSQRYLQEQPDAIMRMNIGILFYYAMTAQEDAFNVVKSQTEAAILQHDTFHHGQVALFEGILLAQLQKIEEGAAALSYALNIFEAQNNIEYGYMTLRYIEASDMVAYVEKYPTCLALIEHKATQGHVVTHSSRLAMSELMQPYHKQYFSNIVSPILYASHEQAKPVYEKYLHAQQPLFCLAWQFNTTQISMKYGGSYERKHCHRLLRELIQLVEPYPIRLTTTDFNQGIALARFENFNDLKDLLIKIEAHFASLTLYDQQTSDVSIHFGVTISEGSPYEKAVVRAENLLYYAKTKQQLYMK